MFSGEHPWVCHRLNRAVCGSELISHFTRLSQHILLSFLQHTSGLNQSHLCAVKLSPSVFAWGQKLCLGDRAPSLTDFCHLELQFSPIQFNKHLLSFVPQACTQQILNQCLLNGKLFLQVESYRRTWWPFLFVLEAVQCSGSECKLWSQAHVCLKLGSMTYKIYYLVTQLLKPQFPYL